MLTAQPPARILRHVELVLRAHGSNGDAVDVLAVADGRHTVGELADAIAPLLPGISSDAGFGSDGTRPTVTHPRRAGVLDADTTLADSVLLTGDEIVVGAPVATVPASPLPVRAMVADVLAGADAGTSTVLLPGRYVVGCDPAADLRLRDPTVSPRHAVVDVSDDWTVSLSPHTDAQRPVHRVGTGTTAQPLGRTTITAPTAIGEHDVMELGATRLMIRPFVRDPLPASAPASDDASLGHVEFHRTPYHRQRITPRRLDPLGQPPNPPEPRRLRILAGLAPAAGGLSMFAFSGGNPRFLLLVLVSPLVMVANWLDDRKHGRRRHADEVAAFRRRLQQRRADVAAACATERTERIVAAPDLAVLARRAELRAANLWERSRDADDFLTLRLGIGSVPSLIIAEAGPSGDDPFAAEVAAANDGIDMVPAAPVTVDLLAVPVLAIHGAARSCTALAAAMVAQTACLHSPDDLVIAAVLTAGHDADRWLGWLAWLPHTRTPTSPLDGDHLASEADGARRLLTAVTELARTRRADRYGGAAVDESGTGCWPRFLVVLDLRTDVEPALVAQLLEHAGTGGLSVLLLAERAAMIPRQATAIVQLDAQPGGNDDEIGGGNNIDDDDIGGRLWSAGDGSLRRFAPELLHPSTADRLARTLAPLRDASSGSPTAAIARHAGLLDVLGVGVPNAEWVAGNWRHRTGAELSVPIGVGLAGPVVVDLVADGPHALIGGTSGSGKSELLQALVAGLAARHPPTLLTFLFVDYKGGAATAPFAALAHTVGCVSNLTPELARRALVSLRAELDHRMRLLDGRAGDLHELRHHAPDLAPPALVIVVDEFATLAKEIPEFVAGIVDIAQRGRSLGIHLVLATQRPTGAIDDNILANTNLRIALRMLSTAESSAVIGVPDAAAIPVPLRGRAYVRRGPQPPVAVQCAHTGARLIAGGERRPVYIIPFLRGAGVALEAPAATADVVSAGAPTHLTALLAAIAEATAITRTLPPRRPWRDELPATVKLAGVLADVASAPAFAAPGRMVALGLVDVPERQEQRAAVVDLEAGGGLLIFGSGGAGKTTALRTIAASIALCAAPGAGVGGDVEIVAFDFGTRGLADLVAWPTVTSVVPGDDLEAVTRTLAVLTGELTRRRRQLVETVPNAMTPTAATANATEPTATGTTAPSLLSAPGTARWARIVVLVDDLAGLTAAFGASGNGAHAAIGVTVPPDAWPAQLVDLAIEGRQLGIHVVITADRRAAVPSRLLSAIANRIVLRHADAAGYAAHGIGAARAASLDLGPGRGLLDATTTVQIAEPVAPPWHTETDHRAPASDAHAATGESAEASIRATMTGTADASAPHTTTGATDASAVTPRRRLVAGAGRARRRTPSTIASAPLPDVIAARAIPLAAAPAETAETGVLLGVADISGAATFVDLRWSDLLVAGSPRSGRSSTLALVAAQLADRRPAWTIASTTSPLTSVTAARHCGSRSPGVATFLDELCIALDGTRPPVLVVDDLDDLDDPALAPLWARLAKHDAARVVAAVETRALTGYAAHPLVQHVRRARRQLLLCPDDGSEVFGAFGIRAPLRPGLRMTPGRGVLMVDRVATVVQTAHWTAPELSAPRPTASASPTRTKPPMPKRREHA